MMRIRTIFGEYICIDKANFAVSTLDDIRKVVDPFIVVTEPILGFLIPVTDSFKTKEIAQKVLDELMDTIDEQVLHEIEATIDVREIVKEVLDYERLQLILSKVG